MKKKSIFWSQVEPPFHFSIFLFHSSIKYTLIILLSFPNSITVPHYSPFHFILSHCSLFFPLLSFLLFSFSCYFSSQIVPSNSNPSAAFLSKAFSNSSSLPMSLLKTLHLTFQYLSRTLYFYFLSPLYSRRLSSNLPHLFPLPLASLLSFYLLLPLSMLILLSPFFLPSLPLTFPPDLLSPFSYSFYLLIFLPLHPNITIFSLFLFSCIHTLFPFFFCFCVPLLNHHFIFLSSHIISLSSHSFLLLRFFFFYNFFISPLIFIS